MSRVNKLGSLATALVLLPIPLLVISNTNPGLEALKNVAIFSSFSGLILAGITVVYWIVIYRAEIRS